MVDQKIVQAFDLILSRRDRWRTAFLAQLGKNYPEPRGEMEWQAYAYLRNWWFRPWIRRFIEAYKVGKMERPGIIGKPEGPPHEMFAAAVQCLAEGEHARTLPKPEMLTMIAGRAAARGAKFEWNPNRRDAFARVMAEAFAAHPQATNREILEFMRDHPSRIIDTVEEDGTIWWWNSKGVNKSTAWATFQGRCTKMRKKIRK